jgi:periplasmic divalent cation tolerance protein
MSQIHADVGGHFLLCDSPAESANPQSRPRHRRDIYIDMREDQPAYLIVLTTAATEPEAALLARSLVEARLAACVHLHAIRSVYRWEQTVLDQPEWRLAIKTTARLYAAVEAHIHERHSYQVPEIVCLALEQGSDDYLRWLGDNVR